MVFYFCVSSCTYEQLHYLVSVETYSIMQGRVAFLGAGKNVIITKMTHGDVTQTVTLLPTLSLELILAPPESRYSTMAIWPVLVATCKGVLYNCNLDMNIICDGAICM